MYIDQTLCHKIFSGITHAVYPGFYHFKLCDGLFAKSWNFYENNMVQGSAIGRLESGAWVDGHDYQSEQRENTLLPLRKNKSSSFLSMQRIVSKIVIPHLVIRYYIDVSLELSTNSHLLSQQMRIGT